MFEIFKQWHDLVERETGQSLKCIRTDNGGEYIGSFTQYCKTKGIRHERSVPKTPQHNGLAERMNRTIVERVRCMLSYANLPTSFWGEALFAATQLINLSPTTILDGKVPDEVWSGKEVSYKHLRVFGCRAFAHVPKDERTKLENKSKQCICLSYGDDKFGYKLYDPIAKKTLRSRDVKFIEDQNIKDFDKDVVLDDSQWEQFEVESDKDDDQIENEMIGEPIHGINNSDNTNIDSTSVDHASIDNTSDNEQGETSYQIHLVHLDRLFGVLVV